MQQVGKRMCQGERHPKPKKPVQDRLVEALKSGQPSGGGISVPSDRIRASASLQENRLHQFVEHPLRLVLRDRQADCQN